MIHKQNFKVFSYLQFLKINFILFSFAFICFFSSCDLKDNKDVNLQDKFFKIFDNDKFSSNFIPIDVKQTSDGGYVILGGARTDSSDFYGVYVMKTDAEGKFVSDQTLTSNNVNPIYNLMQIGSIFYFFCMDNITLSTKLMGISEGGIVAEVAVLPYTYPLYASLDASGNGFLLQHYNRDERKTYLVRLTEAGVQTQSAGFDIGFGEFDVEEPIIRHLTRLGRQLPFLTGFTTDGSYFFNGYYNYTLSLVFVNFASPTNPGVLQGFRDERAVSSALHISGNNFAISRFGFNDNFILPNVTLNTSPGALAASSDLKGNSFPELAPNARVILKRITVNGKNVLLYATDTKGKQILLLAYDEASGVLLGTQYLGFQNPYELAGLTLTTDGGLAVVGTTFVAGRFSRICLFKLSGDEIKDLATQ